MKKRFAFLLITILIISLSACSRTTAQVVTTASQEQATSSIQVVQASVLTTEDSSGTGLQDNPIATEETEEDSSDDEEDAIVTLINLADIITITGEGATANGTIVNITAGGTYRIRGILTDGQVEVNTTEKVKIQLDGVSITNTSGPALMITDAKKVNLKLIKGTINTLSDAENNSENDAAIFTNDTLVIKGEGTLIVNGNNQEGISSDDDIIIENGIVHITAKDDGLNAHDDITISGGYVVIQSGGDATDSNGTTNISGGTIYAMGSIGGGDGGIDSINTFVITGGTLVATGNTSAAPDSTSTQASVYINYSSNLEAGTLFNLSQNGNEVLTFAPSLAYMAVLYSSPDLITGETYQATSGGSSSGTSTDGFYQGGIYISNTDSTSMDVTAAIVPEGAGQMGPGGGGFGGGQPGDGTQPEGGPGGRPGGGMQPPTQAQ
jgi:hypothetical protein